VNRWVSGVPPFVLVPGSISPLLAALIAIALFAKKGAQENDKEFFPGQRADHTPYAMVNGYLAFSATLFIPGLPWFVTATGWMLYLVLFSWARSVGA
jgi:hypothetical protein